MLYSSFPIALNLIFILFFIIIIHYYDFNLHAMIDHLSIYHLDRMLFIPQIA